jgi:hypothetical protein
VFLLKLFCNGYLKSISREDRMIQEKILLKLNKNKLANPGNKLGSTAFFHKFPTFSFSFYEKTPLRDGDVTRFPGNRKWCYANRIQRVFHREGRRGRTAEYLLKTHSFPHCPQVFPQGLSTAGPGVWKRMWIYIKIPDRLRQHSHFFVGRVFYHSFFFVQKITLDKRRLLREKAAAASVDGCKKF